MTSLLWLVKMQHLYKRISCIQYKDVEYYTLKCHAIVTLVLTTNITAYGLGLGLKVVLALVSELLLESGLARIGAFSGASSAYRY